MNKKDFIPVILIALLIPVWMFVDRTFIAPRYGLPMPVPAENPPETSGTSPVSVDARIGSPTVQPAEAVKVAPPLFKEKTATLKNSSIQLTITSRGGGIKNATLFAYPALNQNDSPPVHLDFSDHPALAYSGLAGLGAADEVLLKKTVDNQVQISKTLPHGLQFQRIISLGDNYLITVEDRFTNISQVPLSLPAIRIQTGYIANPADTEAMQGVHILGVDTFTPAGGINYWGRKINKLYKKNGHPEHLNATPETMRREVVDWVSAKNKFFTQILRPKEPAGTMAVLSRRDMSKKGIVPKDIAAALDYRPSIINAEADLVHNYSFYIGPKQYFKLKAAGHSMEKVMEFETIGFWSFANILMEPSRKALLYAINFFHGIIPGGYGISIILLTLAIRILLWPLTHKSTESMKRMQEIQPEIKALQEKNKKEPQRMQQDIMKLYKEKKVNPMSGCLPLIIQLPVFIALFTVLRNAIELRFSSFLWITDLSRSENLFSGHIPVVGALNILPLLMSASMIWQQKLSTPTAATPEQRQQQKIMMVMGPILMLIFFYTMPSGLVLYWTTSNLLMIAQTGFRGIRKKFA